VDGGGLSNWQWETPGFLAERGFLIRLIHNSMSSRLRCSLQDILGTGRVWRWSLCEMQACRGRAHLACGSGCGVGLWCPCICIALLWKKGISRLVGKKAKNSSGSACQDEEENLPKDQQNLLKDQHHVPRDHEWQLWAMWWEGRTMGRKSSGKE